VVVSWRAIDIMLASTSELQRTPAVEQQRATAAAAIISSSINHSWREASALISGEKHLLNNAILALMASACAAQRAKERAAHKHGISKNIESRGEKLGHLILLM